MTTNKRVVPSNSGETPAIVCFVSGMAAVLMCYSVYSHLKTLHDRSTQPKKTASKRGTKLEDSIRLKSLAYLTQSHNVNIHSSSVKIILERAMSGTYLSKIIAACDKDQPIEIKSKALPSLQLLTRKEINKTALLDAGALNVLVDALKCTDPDMKEVTQRYVAVAICDLIQGSDVNKFRILELGVLDPIKRILTSEKIRNNELKYWTLMILYQISLSDPLPKVLIESGFVSLLARMARMTYGNTNMPKFCMQSLVRIAANVDVSEAKNVLTELLDYNIVDLISNCLRGDDVELIYWAAGLMHEFVLKDVAADRFREIKGIHVILAGLLSAEEMYISRVILRTIKFMAYGQDKFRHEMVRSGMVKKIMHCLSLDDEDVRYWAILCIHVVAGQVESHEDIISAPEFEVLLELALSTKIKVAIFVSDILSLICCISCNNTFMEPNLNIIVKTLNTLLIEGELDVQYNAAGAIFNVMTMTSAFANKVRDTCFESLVLMATSAAHERVQLTCTKGALMVVIKNRFLIPQINDQVTGPLIETVTSLAQLVLPIMMNQAIIQAAKEEYRATKTGFSIHEAMNIDLNDEDQEIIEDRPTSSKYILEEEEDADEEVDRLLRAPDYIDVSEQGTISNASRLDHVLKDRERSKYKKNRRNNAELIDLLTHDDISYLFDPTIPNSEREALFMKFELPLSARNQLVGALTALNILLENDKVIGNVVTGETFKNPILDVLDDIVIDIDDIDSSLYNRRLGNNHSGDSSSSTNNRNTIAASILSAEASGSSLPDNIRQFVQSLVYLVVCPALEEWATTHHHNYPLNTLCESRANGLYVAVVDWICDLAKPPQIKSKSYHSSNSSDADCHSSGCSGELGSQQQTGDTSFKATRSSNMNGKNGGLYNRRNRHQHHSDMGSDSEDDDDDSDDDRVFISVYPRQSRRIESAAERLGETRRRGEQIDLEDMPSVSYASKHYLGFSNRALILLNSLLRYASVRQYLIQDIYFIPILIYLFEDYNSLADRVMACLGSLFGTDPSISIDEASFQVLAILLWRGNFVPLFCRKQSYLFYSRLVLSYCSRCVSTGLKPGAATNNPAFTEIDLVSRSKYCTINYENCLQVRNDTWTFETVRATRCVPAIIDKEDDDGKDEQIASHKYAFEVKLESDGLMQLGWASEHFEFDPEGGKGVGDDTHSYGYDGYRAKKWHGRYSTMRTSYGLKWAEGDIITCAIDMDVGEIGYYKNGVDMGVAFYGVVTSRAWYPAISLATGQQCKLQFGGAIDPLRYLPEGYTPVGALELQAPMNVELPPPHFTKSKPSSTSLPELDESDITDLARAMEKMTFNSPVSPRENILENCGNVEPNLRPVDGGLNTKPKASSKNTQSEVHLPQQQHMQQKLIPVSKPSSHEQNSLPSLYFEVTIGLLQPDIDLSISESAITFGLRSLFPEGSICFSYDRQQRSCILVIDIIRSESFPLELQDGDKIGVAYIKETNAVGVTHQGTVKALIYLGQDIKTMPYLPFVSGYIKSEINYGEESFAWKLANSVPAKQHISGNLYRILGDRTPNRF